jgi:hypothetical protein
MRVYGIDFTCAPRRTKPLTCAVCEFDGQELNCEVVLEWTSKRFHEFEKLLSSDGPWVMGIDAPFGLAKTFIKDIGWPLNWEGYVKHLEKIDRRQFRWLLKNYRDTRPKGHKEHKRAVDKLVRSMSPQNIRVCGMFFEVAKLIVASSACVPPVRMKDYDRIVVETYPGVMARRLIGNDGYKDGILNDIIVKQSALRARILTALPNVKAPADVIKNSNGDQLDALLCAVQAAWAWSRRDANYGIPSTADPLEGWIVDESLYEAAA